VIRVEQLVGRYVVLEPLRGDHVTEIERAGRDGRDSFTYTGVPDGPDEAERYVDALLADAVAGKVAPFVQRRVDDGAVVGCTRFMEPRWPLGRPDPDEIEVGGTWLAAPAQRTGINTEAKLLLLTHAFDGLGVQRVAICTDERNTRSRHAIERIGARFEGTLRRHRASYVAGEQELRDTAVYSIIGPEWPAVRERLERLARP
jgi:RimJ/RimL family protein N-acetyltransferase